MRFSAKAIKPPGSSSAFTAVPAATPSNIRQPAQCRAKTDTSAAHQRRAENFGLIVPKCSGKPCRDLPTAENRARHAVAIRRMLVGDEIALPGSVPDRVGADRPEIRVAAKNLAIPDDDHTAGPALDAVEHLDVYGIKSILHGGPVGDTFSIRQTLNQNPRAGGIMFFIRQAWHIPATGGGTKFRGTHGSPVRVCS